MYTDFYNLTEPPFTISTESRYLWMGEKHQEALANLKYGLLEADGYVVLTGDVGIGKTTLVNALLDEIDDSVMTVTISHPTLSPEEFFRFLTKTWGGPRDLQGKTDFLFFFKEFLEKSREEGKSILVIIDEAHRLSEELLEEIRLLSNMEQQGKRLVNIFFVGQIELKEMLLTPQFRALRQRITLFYDIEPLNVRETGEYILHRLQVAGGSKTLFSKEAIYHIHRFTRGYPRLINILCDRAMLTGYVQDKYQLDTKVVAECVEELGFLDPNSPRESMSHRTGQQMLREQVVLRGGENSSPTTVNPSSEEKQTIRPSRASRKKKATLVYSGKRRKQRMTITTILLIFTLLAGAAGWLFLTEPGREVATRLEIDKWVPESSFSLPEILSLMPFYTQLPERNSLVAADKSSSDQPESMAASSQQGPDDGEPSTPAESVEPVESAEPDADIDAQYYSSPSQQQNLSVDDQTVASIGPGLQHENLDEPPSDDLPGTKETTAELASAALAEKQYQSVIDMLVFRMEEETAKEDEKLSQIYGQALVGRAEQILKFSPEKAQALLEKAIEIDGSIARAYFLLGKSYTAASRYKEAIDAYLNAGLLDPGLADAFFNLGFIYAASGKYSESERYFLHTVELTPPYMGKALFNLAVVQDKLGKTSDSLENLYKAQSYSPENDKIAAYLQKVQTKKRSRP